MAKKILTLFYVILLTCILHIPQNVASENPRNQFAIELEGLGKFYGIAIIIFKNKGEKIKLI